MPPKLKIKRRSLRQDDPYLAPLVREAQEYYDNQEQHVVKFERSLTIKKSSVSHSIPNQENPQDQLIHEDFARRIIRKNSVVSRNKSREESVQIKQNTKFKQLFGNGLYSLFQNQDQDAEAIIQEIGDYQVRVNNLIKSSKSLTMEQRISKGYRHFQDALLQRFARNDFDVHQSKFVYFVFWVQTHPFFQLLLWYLAMVFTFLSFYEPANRLYIHYQVTEVYYILEIIILSAFGLDFLMEVFHLYFDIDRPNKVKYFLNYKLIFTLIFECLFLADSIYFYQHQFDDPLRFARYFRPFWICNYSKEISKKIKSLFQSLQQILQLFIFYFVMILFWALVSIKVIGDLGGETHYDEYSQNYDNLLTATSILYALATPDLYPDCILPAYETSQYYLIFFITYIILFELVFLPIPVAIVFEAYKGHRGEIIIMDRLKQRESLLACFIAIDYDGQKKISDDTFYNFMKTVYLNKKRYLKRIDKLFSILDSDQNKQISINEFFEIIDCLEADNSLWIPTFPDLKAWLGLRGLINRYLKFKIIAKSLIYELIMFLVTTVNSVVVIIIMFSNDEDLNIVLGEIDDICLYFYIVECIIKIIGLGVEKYFEDDWNIFDFCLVVISLASDFFLDLIGVVKGAKSLKSSKIFKLSKLKNAFKAIRSIRSVKIINFLILGADTIMKIKSMVDQIFICIPIIFQFLPILWMLFYIYTIFGMEFFNISTQHYKEGGEFEDFDYADFTTFGGGLLLLFQISVGPEWSKIAFNYAHKFENYFRSIVFFYSFQMIVQLIFLALVKGIIWEIFSVVDHQSAEQNMIIESLQSSYSNEECDLQQQQIRRQSTHKPIKPTIKFTDRKDLKHLMIQQDHLKFDDAIVSILFQFFKKVYDRFLTTLVPQEQTEIPSESPTQRVLGIQMNMFRIQSQIYKSFNSQRNQPQEKIDIIYAPMKVLEGKLNANQLESIDSIQQRFISVRPASHKSFIVIDNLIVLYQPLKDEEVNRKKMISFLLQRIRSIESIKHSQRQHLSEQKTNQKQGEIDIIVFDSDNEEQINIYNNQIVRTLSDQQQEKYQEKLVGKDDGSDDENQQSGQMNNYLSKKAYLKDTNIDRIKQIEYNFFEQFYGRVFGDIKQIKLEPLLKIEAQILHNFEKLLRFNYQDAKSFIQLLTVIEANISSILLKQGSVVKFLFQDQYDNWVFFCLDDQHNLFPLKAQNGPWIISDFVL